jgi:uncharacterized protein (DUF1684 family)
MRKFAAVCLVLLAMPTEAGDFAAEQQAWQRKRLENLVREESWTSLVGLHWLDPAVATRIGSNPDNEVVIAGLPERFGVIRHDDGRWLLAPAPGIEARVDGAELANEMPILGRGNDAAARAPKVEAGRIRFVLIERAGRVGVRVWDTQAPTRVDFPGIEMFAVDPGWQVDARWQAHPPGRTIDIASVIGTIEPMPNPGVAIFERDGREFRLEALRENGSDELFFIFADRTSGKTTYGAGRYLYTPLPLEAVVTLDFNRAFNPPCAFSSFATCPLPPPENRLDLRVTAGEKAFRGHH